MASSPPHSPASSPSPSPPSPYTPADCPTRASPTSPPLSPLPYTPPAYSSPGYSPTSPVYYSPTSPGRGDAWWLWPRSSPSSTLDPPRSPSPTSPGYDEDSPSPIVFLRPPLYSPTSPGYGYFPVLPDYGVPPSPVYSPASAGYSYSHTSPIADAGSPCYQPGVWCELEQGLVTPHLPPASPEYCYGCSTPVEDCCCQASGRDGPAALSAGGGGARHVPTSHPLSPAPEGSPGQ